MRRRTTCPRALPDVHLRGTLLSCAEGQRALERCDVHLQGTLLSCAEEQRALERCATCICKERNYHASNDDVP